MIYNHTPVMLTEVLEFLDPKEGEAFIDATLGGGGYTFVLAKKVGEKGLIVSFDADKLAIDHANELIEKNDLKNIKLIHENFEKLHENIQSIREKTPTREIGGIVFDLGLSSAQLEDRSRGFSFKLDAPLEMRFGTQDSSRNSTFEIVNYYKQEKLEQIFRDYGEERYARSIAKAIIRARKIKPIERTNELVKIISDAVPARYRNSRRLHFATRVFQAIRIATNSEFTSLESALKQAINVVKKGGKIVAVSYHSGEDRIVKHFFKKESRDCYCSPETPECVCGHKRVLKIITKKPLRPKDDEVAANPRARSAKLRVAEMI